MKRDEVYVRRLTSLADAGKDRPLASRSYGAMRVTSTRAYRLVQSTVRLLGHDPLSNPRGAGP